MSQISSSSKKTWGFLVFTLGCIIAISGAAKLHPQDNIMRTRGMLEKITRRTVAKTLSPVVAKAQEILTAAQLEKQSDSQLNALFQSIYTDFLKHGVASLSIKDPLVLKGSLKPNVKKAILALWIMNTFGKKKPESKDPGLKVLADVVKSMSAKPKKKATSEQPKTTQDSPKRSALHVPTSVTKIVLIIRDKSVARLVPYVLWNVVDAQSHKAVVRMAHSIVVGTVYDLARLGLAKLSTKDAMERVGQVASSFARILGKKLKLKSKDYALNLSANPYMDWAKRLGPTLPNMEALRVAREISYALANMVAKQYAGHLTEQLAKRMRLERRSASATLAPSRIRKHLEPRVAPAARRMGPRAIPTTRPSSRPVVVARRTPPPAPKRDAPPAIAKVGGLLILGAKSERIGGWPDTLPIFLFGIFMAFLGLLFWKRGVAMEAAAAMEAQSNDASNPFTLLAEIQSPLEALQKEIDSLSEEEVCNRVDEILSNYVLPFAEVRRGVIDRLGMQQGAEILVVVAYGERMLNRVWSAASDGHLPEARSVLPDAISAFSEAGALSQKSIT